MRIGLHAGVSGRAENAIDDLVEQARRVADAGLHSIWLPQMFDVDALTAIAVIGREVPRIELATAVIPTYPRHPMVLASQALTAQASTGNRLVLGIGLSHQVVIEGAFGYSFDRPARHMREYLSILIPLIHDGKVSFEGETMKAQTLGPLRIPGAEPCPVLVAALGPAMLKLTGEMADGTITWMVGPKTLESHIVPSITQAARAAGRDRPRVVVGLPVCVTDDPEQVREAAAKTFVIYGQLPSYRAMLDREGADGPADVVVAGDEDAVAAQLRAIAEMGATDLATPLFGSPEERRRTLDLLSSLAKEHEGP
jgi:F420-dependent oxidoreductase-like protein